MAEVSSTEQAVLDYVEGTEFRKQLARQVADEVFSEYASGILDGTVDPADVLDAAALSLENIVADAAHDALDHAAELGWDTTNLDEATLVPELAAQGWQDIHDRALELLQGAVDDVAATAETMPPLADIGAGDSEAALLAGVRAILRSTMSGYVNEAERSAMGAAMMPSLEDDPEQLLAWETRMDDSVCDDQFENSCAPRHGWNLTHDEWDQIGIPGDQNLLCSMFAKGATSNCRCVLVPGDADRTFPGGIDVGPAVKRGRAAAKNVDLGTDEEGVQ